MPQANGETILAFDVGLKRTGVAVGQTLTQTANPVTSLTAKNGQLEWSTLDALLERWQPSRCIVGDPKTSDPHLNKLIRRLIHHLNMHKMPVVRVNEHLTSASATAELNDRTLTTEKKIELRDQVAACLILESYFFEFGSTTP